MKTVMNPVSAKRRPADLLIAGYFQGEKIYKGLESLEPAFVKAVKQAVDKGRFEGKFLQFFSSYHSDFKEAPEIVLIGLGKKENYKTMCFRKAAPQIIQIAKGKKAEHVRVLLDSFTYGEVRTREAIELLAQAGPMATYEFDQYKSKKPDFKDKKLQMVEALTERKPAAAELKALEYGRIVAEGILTCRTLINEPANVMNPQRLAAEARQLAVRKKISCEILGAPELKRLKMGGILAVNAGSVTPPALIVLEYGKQYQKSGTICLVGKGVTFDTGGISIKGSKDMEKMKYDMSGAACVISTLGVVADLKLKRHVVGLAPAVENNVAENPQRPGDIIRMYNGKSVEVINTDAEGRLILGDALAYSEKYKPKAIIDLATLTGMCAYTFGDKAIGLMGNDEKLIEKIKDSGTASGERCWQLPMWDEYADTIRGHHSDLYNVGGPFGGTITAAKFLQEFVPAKTPWAHLDIAGTAWADSNRSDCVKGATGVGVRLLADFLSR